MTSIEDDKNKEIPEIIQDPQTNSQYQRLRFFGKGGFATCYEIKDLATKQVWAGKIVSKKLLVKTTLQETIAQEISIHRELSHKHVVAFHSFFEDTSNIYIILELCNKWSMMQLHLRRAALTELETRYYMHQILLGVQYLHSQSVLHRDLSLSNLFLDDHLHVKIGDFGFAVWIEEGEKRQTLCGTPNFIAPEILTKKGYSFAVDIWSVGCVMFTLLVGKLPFHKNNVEEIFKKIKQCEYRIPWFVGKEAMDMIAGQLQASAARRPTADKLLQHEFFSAGIMPSALPLSCLTTPPRMDQLEGSGPGHNDLAMAVESGSHEQRFSVLKGQLTALLAAKLKRRSECLPEELSAPAAQPLLWVSKWIDYGKHGFGYQLGDGSVGNLFNDNTTLIMLPNGLNVHYINQQGQEQYMTTEQYPQDIDRKKMKHLTYIKKYMTEHLVTTGASVAAIESDGLSRVPHLLRWVRVERTVTMWLTNATLQINFMDHAKIIMCPLMQAVTYIDGQSNLKTFRFETIKEHGCDEQLLVHVTYALDQLKSAAIN